MTALRFSPWILKLLYGALFVVLLPVLLVLWARGATGNIHLPAIMSVPIGVILLFAGLALMMAGTVALWRFGGGLPMSPFPPPWFVSGGVYRWLPHPLYTGFAIVCAGASLAVGSAAGEWLVTPTVAFVCAAFYLGHERLELKRRFPDRRATLLHLPPDTPDPPDAANRISALLLVLLPWLLLYEAVQALGVSADAVIAYLPFEARLPVLEWTEAVYASTYVVVVLAPFFAASRADLRHFCVRGWFTTVMGILVFLTVPLVAPPRPLVAHTWLGHVLELERSVDSAAGAFPSFHASWALLAAALLAGRWPRWRGLAWTWSALVGVSCVTTGMHAIVDVAAGIALASAAFRLDRLWDGARRVAERIANSWREWRLGSIRVINHGVWAGAGTFVGLAIVATLLGPGRGGAILLVACVSLVCAALWAQVIEGSPSLLRPYGYYGGVLGVVLGALVAPPLGTSPWSILAAFAVAGPWIQSAGRLRCLVQGCCHGSPAPLWLGIRYTHPRSRVCRLSEFGGLPIHPTPLYSILWNAVIALLETRLWLAGCALPLIAGCYLILTGLGRFVEEAYRGEPQTPVFAGLRLYQWVAAGTIIAGAAMTTVRGAPAPTPTVHVAALVPAAIFGVLTWLALGVDFPESSRRFARLV